VPQEHLKHLYDAIEHYGYAVVFVFIFIENFGIPVPGQAIFVAALVMASRGKLGMAPTVLCAWSASVAGGAAGYAIGRFGGRTVLEKYGGYIWIGPERLKKMESFFAKYGGAVVVFARFFEGFRQVYAILAGCVDPSWRKFLAQNVLGATIWVGLWTALVIWFGPHLRRIWIVFKEHEIHALLAIAVVAAASAAILALYRRIKRTRDVRTPK
jgi:membrane protein DedA with SNARE-associated domain